MTLKIKKVLFITLRSDTGGGPKHLLDLCTGIKDIEIHIASPTTLPFGEKFQSIATGFIELKHREFSFIKLFKILHYCKENGIDLIHSHGRGAGLYSRILYLFGVRVIHTFHGAHYDNNFIGRVKVLIDKFLKNNCDNYICVSEDEFNKAKEMNFVGNTKVSVINNGVSILNIRDSLSIGFPKEGVEFGTLARLSYQKGIDILIDELSKNKTPNHWKFIIAGEGEEERFLKEKVNNLGLQDKIIFLGNVSKPLEFLNRIDVYFSTSRWEGLPIGVLEAMSLGKPCILSNVEGHREFNKIMNSVLLYDDFVEECHEIILMKEQYSKMALNNVKENFSLESMCNSTRKLFI
ncbi:MAG: hypothetical protein BM556_08840 [Bacteriovorax sp. MedPE-SWde]|nr:MAG: hypothetical protein BM556_08840 [Bacteriovorax sp. MedPE-SWde]